MVTLKRGDLLLDLKTGKRTFAAVYDLWAQQKLPSVPKIVRQGGLEAVLLAWVKTAHKKNGEKLADTTRKAYTNSFKQLLKLANPTHILRDLPAVLTAYRVQCIANQHFMPFNHTVTRQ